MADWQFGQRVAECHWKIHSTKTIRLQQNDKKRTASRLAVRAFLWSLFHRTVAALQAVHTKLRRLDTFASSLVPRFRRFRNLNDYAPTLDFPLKTAIFVREPNEIAIVSLLIFV
jgi:hypothetical protein